MEQFITAACTDKGNLKDVNQDALVIEEAETVNGNILLAAVADGLGGLAAGEIASRKMAEALSGWFENSLAATVSQTGRLPSLEDFRNEMNFLLSRTATDIYKGEKESCGTTVTAILFGFGEYHIVHVGDTRAYVLDGEFKQLTKDQTYIQRMIDRGEITEEEAETHPKRSVLIQCVGASEFIAPQYLSGHYEAGMKFMICSDGFRHKVKAEEFKEGLLTADTEDELKDLASTLTDLNLKRGETDNISSIFIHITE